VVSNLIEAELLAIGSYYKTADEIDDSVRNGSIQAWLDGNNQRSLT
jgi:septum formation inhibitor MinC